METSTGEQIAWLTDGVNDIILNNHNKSSAANSSQQAVVQTTDLACVSSTGYGIQLLVVSHGVFWICSIVFVIIGLTGNTLSIVVFCSKRMRTVSSNVYLLFLAISDSVYLVGIFLSRTTTTLRCWYFSSATFDVVNRSRVACKLLQFLADVFSDFSSCLILAFTVERFLAVYAPTRIKELCTVRRSRVVCASLLTSIAVFIAPHHVLFIDVLQDFCTVVVEHEGTFMIMYVVELFLFRIVPVVAIAAFNVSIIVRVSKIRAEKRRQAESMREALRRCVAGGDGSKRCEETGGESIPVEGTGDRGNACGELKVASRLSKAGTLLGAMPTVGGKLSSVGQKLIKHKSMRTNTAQNSSQVTLMLTVVSTSHVIVCIPEILHFVVWKLHRAGIISVSEVGFLAADSYIRSLYIAGFAINFFLYTVSGNTFRRELIRTICRRH